MSEAAAYPIIVMEDVQILALRDFTVTVLEQVNWSVLPGEFWVVAGPPHSGKSDLLLHAAGLLRPRSGVCRLFGTDTRDGDDDTLAVRRRVGLTFSDAKLFKQFTVAENIALALRYHQNLSDEEAGAAIETWLDALDLRPYANVLSGNLALVWQQRTALARALAWEPELMLLDNPNAGLTTRHRQWLVHFLDQLGHGHPAMGGRPLTIVVTTDDLSAWQNPRRHYAAVHEGRFSVLGSWGGDAFIRHRVVQDLLDPSITEPK